MLHHYLNMILVNAIFDGPLGCRSNLLLLLPQGKETTSAKVFETVLFLDFHCIYCILLADHNFIRN